MADNPPDLTVPVTDMPLPTLQKDRKDKELPRKQPSSKEAVKPALKLSVTESENPASIAEPTETLSLIWASFDTDRSEPIAAVVATEIQSPKSTGE